MAEQYLPRIDVVAAIIVQEGRILITQRKKGVHLELLWEFPGGKVEAGETDEVALKREIQEELGIEIAVGGLFFRQSFTYPERRVSLRFYQAEPRANQLLKTRDVLCYRWIWPGELKDFHFPPANTPMLEKMADYFR